MANRPLSELVQHVASQRRVWVRAAAVRQDEGWAPALIEITLGGPPPGWRRARWRYPRAVFVASSPKGTTAAGWLRRGRVTLAPPAVAFEPGDTASCDWRESEATTTQYEPLSWPSRLWSIYATGTVSLSPQGELVALDAPAFLSFEEAALAFFSIPRAPNRRFTSPEIVVREQLLSARIEAVVIRQAEIVVGVGGTGLRGATLSLGGVGSASKRLTAGASHVRLPISAPLGAGAWLALHRGEELLDRRVLDPAWRQPDVEVEVDLATQVQVLVSRGEGPAIEFKRQLPGENPSGPMKTISAFANGDGGVIMFGVDDDGQIVGLDDENLPTALDRLAMLISDWIRPPIDCSPEAVEIDGAKVVIVRVPAAAETPYGVGRDDRKLVYYVRRGATSAPARPSDVRAIVRSRLPPPAETL